MEYARIFLISFCTKPIVAAKTAVTAPTIAINSIVTGASAKRIEHRATIYTPAVTIVAAWIKALTGVGPAIASGNQTYKGICADLPIAPTNSSIVIHKAVVFPIDSNDAPLKTVPKFRLPNVEKINSIPRMNPKSPMRLTTNAFFAASPVNFSSYQNPISK